MPESDRPYSIETDAALSDPEREAEFNRIKNMLLPALSSIPEEIISSKRSISLDSFDFDLLPNVQLTIQPNTAVRYELEIDTRSHEVLITKHAGETTQKVFIGGEGNYLTGKKTITYQDNRVFRTHAEMSFIQNPIINTHIAVLETERLIKEIEKLGKTSSSLQ